MTLTCTISNNWAHVILQNPGLWRCVTDGRACTSNPATERRDGLQKLNVDIFCFIHFSPTVLPPLVRLITLVEINIGSVSRIYCIESSACIHSSTVRSHSRPPATTYNSGDMLGGKEVKPPNSHQTGPVENAGVFLRMTSAIFVLVYHTVATDTYTVSTACAVITLVHFRITVP